MASDLAALLALELACFPAPERWGGAGWVDELQAPNRHVRVVRDQTGSVAAASTFQNVLDVSDLNRVMVAPSHRGRGLGRMLVAEGLDWARSQGAERVLLEVRADNGPATALYRALGFAPIGRRKDYYAAGADALVMELPLASAGQSTGRNEENHG